MQRVDCVRIVHLVRGSLQYVNWKERRTVAQDLRVIYQAATTEQAQQERELFGGPLGW